LVVKVEDGMPAEECSCHRCKAGLTDIGDDDVSDFFNDLHMVRGRKGVWKIIDGKEVRRYSNYNMHKNDLHTFVSFVPMIHFSHLSHPKHYTKIPLTKDELDTIAYPYQRFIHLGSFALFALPEPPKTFYTSNDKGFTVGQLADAMAKAEECNIGKYNELGAKGGGWYFEGFTRGKDPHSFIVGWGTNMSSRRVGVGVGLNHINTRAYEAENKKALPKMNMGKK
jgi:hypothetical protein